jgi:hypothetical protein
MKRILTLMATALFCQSFAAAQSALIPALFLLNRRLPQRWPPRPLSPTQASRS